MSESVILSRIYDLEKRIKRLESFSLQMIPIMNRLRLRNIIDKEEVEKHE